MSRKWRVNGGEVDRTAMGDRIKSDLERVREEWTK